MYRRLNRLSLIWSLIIRYNDSFCGIRYVWWNETWTKYSEKKQIVTINRENFDRSWERSALHFIILEYLYFYKYWFCSLICYLVTHNACPLRIRKSCLSRKELRMVNLHTARSWGQRWWVSQSNISRPRRKGQPISGFIFWFRVYRFSFFDAFSRDERYMRELAKRLNRAVTRATSQGPPWELCMIWYKYAGENPVHIETS